VGRARGNDSCGLWLGVDGGTSRRPEEELLLAVEHGDLAGALARLSPELRAVVQATVLDGLSTREASVLLGIPVGTVKTRAMRARRQLREELA
jgi:RNA polymerase sigma-70 factor, ECF subfamily